MAERHAYGISLSLDVPNHYWHACECESCSTKREHWLRVPQKPAPWFVSFLAGDTSGERSATSAEQPDGGRYGK